MKSRKGTNNRGKKMKTNTVNVRKGILYNAPIQRFPIVLAFGVILLAAFTMSATAFGTESGYIESASPSSFTSGVPTEVIVRVRNTGDGDDMIIEWDSKPSGWSISPSPSFLLTGAGIP